MSEPAWLAIGRELRAIAQTGLNFTQDRFDAQRYERIRELAAALMAEGANEDPAKVLELFRRTWATPRPRSTCAAPPSGTAGCSWFAKSATAAGRCRAAGRT